MAIFLSSYDPDTIEAALGHQNTRSMCHAYRRLTASDQRIQLMEHWADIVDQFSWQQRPSNPGETFGIS